MKYQGIFFDLDGTLLPMDNDTFVKNYLGLLAKTVAHLGYTPEGLIPAIWKGVAAMMKNDGSRTNAEAYWEAFCSVFGESAYEHLPYFDAFYRNEFHGVKALTSPTPSAREAVQLAREKAGCVVLATNPIFPRVAVESRLAWAGLAMEDFDLVTTYEESRFCKPSPAYFTEITGKLELDPTKCLMIGNNAREDAWAAQQAGLSAYLLTDCLIDEDGLLEKGLECPKGTSSELVEYLKAL